LFIVDSITLEQEGNDVTVSCTGEGPLADKTFQGAQNLHTHLRTFMETGCSLMSHDDDSANNSTMDIHNYTTGYNEYSFKGSGALDGFSITGVYHYSRISTAPETVESSWFEYEDEKSESHHPIAMNILFTGSQMTITCNTSEGPMTGLTFSGGIKQPTP
jgi:hypothetical protein